MIRRRWVCICQNEIVVGVVRSAAIATVDVILDERETKRILGEGSIAG